MTHSIELVEKYGNLVQFGVDYMSGFSQFADEFLEKFYEHKPEIDIQGYSLSWNDWRIANSEQIILLHDALKAENLIPTSVSE